LISWSVIWRWSCIVFELNYPNEREEIRVTQIPKFGENENPTIDADDQIQQVDKLLLRMMLLKSIMENKTRQFKISH